MIENLWADTIIAWEQAAAEQRILAYHWLLFPDVWALMLAGEFA